MGGPITGRIARIIDKICRERSKGNETIYSTTKTKLLLKGINPDLYDEFSPDDPAVIADLKEIAIQMGITI